MLKDTEKELLAEQTLPPDPPKKKWTCKCMPRTYGEGVIWSYDPGDWCDPIEYRPNG